MSVHNRFTIEMYGFTDGLHTLLVHAIPIALKDSQDSLIEDNGRLENESEIYTCGNMYL